MKKTLLALSLLSMSTQAEVGQVTATRTFCHTLEAIVSYIKLDPKERPFHKLFSTGQCYTYLVPSAMALAVEDMNQHHSDNGKWYEVWKVKDLLGEQEAYIAVPIEGNPA